LIEDDRRSKFSCSDVSIQSRGPNHEVLEYQFEREYLDYEDDQIGSLDEEDPKLRRDVIDPAYFESVMDEFLKSQESQDITKPDTQLITTKDSKTKTLKQISLELLRRLEANEQNEVIEEESSDSDQWDCESIVSTYSNTENHPKKITEPQKTRIILSKKSGIPLDVLPNQPQPKEKN